METFDQYQNIGGFFMRSKKLQPSLEAAIMAALALVIDLLPSIKLGPWISISFAMVPVFLVSFRWGVKYGMLSGFLWSLLQVITGDAYFLHWYQFIIEYFIAFTCIGFAGIFSSSILNSFNNGEKGRGLSIAVFAMFIGTITRYIWHFYAGIVFWGEYAPEGMGVWMYSFIVNGGSGFGSFVFCAIVLGAILSISSRLLTANNQYSYNE